MNVKMEDVRGVWNSSMEMMMMMMMLMLMLIL